MAGRDPPEEVELLGRRLDVLDRFADGPARKRDAVDDLDCSRSTLDRAVRRLTDADLLERTPEGYVTSLAGRLAADRYRAFLADERAVLDRAGVLSALPADADLPVAMLRDATVETVGDDAHAPVERVLTDLRTADRYRAALPRLADTRHLRLCHARVVRDALETTLLASPDLVDRLRREFPRLAAALADAATVDVVTADLPGFGLVVADHDGATTVTVLAYDEGSIAAIIRNDGEAPADWGRERIAGLAAAGSVATGRLRPGETAVPDDPPLGEPAALSDEGFVRVDRTYLANRVPNDPAAGWRGGFDVVDVYYGHALDRTAPPGGDGSPAVDPGASDRGGRSGDGPLGAGRSAPTGDVAGRAGDDGTADGGAADAGRASGRRSLAASLFDRLRTDGHQVVVGPPGTGKSTLCRTVACQWIDAGVGDVLYRSAPVVGGVDRVGPLVDAIERDDGHTLVVVEDAAGEGVTGAVARLVDRYRDDGTATVLLEARTDAWAGAVERTDPDAGPVGRGELPTFGLPAADEVECRRALDAFEAATGRSVPLSAGDLHDRVRDAPGVGDLYLVGFHLTAATDPESVAESTLDASVTALYDELTGRTDGGTAAVDGSEGDRSLAAEVGVLVATLTAAGLTVTPDVVHAVAADRGPGTDATPSPHVAVERALDRLTGRMLFDRGDGPAYRTHHPYWGVRFLERAVDRDERRARALFERALSALFALADDPDRRARIEDWLGRESAALDAFRDADAVSAVAESVAGLAVRHSEVMPLFGTSGRSGIDLPAAASPAVELSWISARLVGWHDQGALDRAVAEAELLSSLAPAATDLDEDERGRYVATAHGRLGEIAGDRGDVETAREQFRAALSVAEAVDDDRTEIRHRNSLAWLSMTRGEYDRARDHLTRAVELADDEVFRYRTTTRYYLGRLEMFRGDYAAAEPHLRRAREFDRELGDRQGEAVTLQSLGRVAAEEGDHERAEQYYRRSLALQREAGMRDAAAETRVALADLLVDVGALDGAATHAEAALETLEEFGKERGCGDARSALGRLERERGNPDVAREHYRRGRDRHESADHDRGVAAADLGLGDVERDAGDVAAAVERYEAAYERFRDVDAPGRALDAVDRLVAVARERDDLATAVEWCETGRDLASEAGLKERGEQFGDRCEELAAEAARGE